MLRGRTIIGPIRAFSADLTQTWMVSRGLFWPSSMFTMPFITETSFVCWLGVTNSYMHISRSPCTCQHAHILTLTSARKWCILTLEPPITHLPTLEISRLRFKSSFCSLINSQKSPWPGFYTWNPSTLYQLRQRSMIAAYMANLSSQVVWNYFLHHHSTSTYLHMHISDNWCRHWT